MKITKSLRLPFFMVLTFWAIWLVSIYFAIDFNRYVGLFPRTISGLFGIIFSPFLHGSFFHLLQNSVPFVILGGMVLYFYPKIANRVFGIIYLGTGFGVWLFARSSYHLGASGLVYGFASFLFFSGLFRRNIPAMALSAIVAILYGSSMIEGIFPVEAHISWESHLIGAVTGGFSAWYYRSLGFSLFETEETRTENIPYQVGFQNIENEYIKYFFIENKITKNNSSNR